MSQLKKCCDKYTIKGKCPECNETPKDAHYRFEKIRDAVPNFKQG